MPVSYVCMCTQEHNGKWNTSSCGHKKCLLCFLLSGLKWATRHRRANDAFVHTCCPWGMCKFARKVVLKMEILPLNCREYGLVQSTVVNLRQRQARQIYLWGFEAGGAVLYKDWSLSAYSSWNFSPRENRNIQFNLFRVSQPSILSSKMVQTSLQHQQTILLWLYNVGSHAKVKRI